MDFFIILDEVAVALLPLAVEYQIKCLQEICSAHFSRASLYDMAHIPTLEMLTLAETHSLADLKEKMLIKCAAKLGTAEIDRQRLLPENKAMTEQTYIRLLR